jgi:hypothetical protein
MKEISTSSRTLLLVLIGVAVFLGFIGCGAPAGGPLGSNSGNKATNSNANLLPPPSPTPTPTPPCNDSAINQKLLEAWRSPGNSSWVAPIRGTINFYSRDCTIYLWGYTRNLGAFKRLEQMGREAPNSIRAFSINDDNLYIQANEYPPGGPPCASGYKACNDICIPQDDNCLTEITVATPDPVNGNQNKP